MYTTTTGTLYVTSDGRTFLDRGIACAVEREFVIRVFVEELSKDDPRCGPVLKQVVCEMLQANAYKLPQLVAQLEQIKP